MNTKIVMLLSIVVVIIAAGFYFLTKSPDTNDATGTEADKEATDSKDFKNSGRGSFASLMNSGENIKCSFSTTEEDAVSTGVFYHSGGKYRVEAETQSEGQTYQTNMIGLSNKTYMWGSSPEGEMAFVMSNDMMNNDGAVAQYTETQGSAAVDMETEAEYDCDSWRPNTSVFVPPSDVEFVDIEVMMREMFSAEIQGLPEGFKIQAQ